MLALGKGCGWVSAGTFAGSVLLAVLVEFADGTKSQHSHVKEAWHFGAWEWN